MTGFALFETAIGWCGIAWAPRGIVGVQLPEGSAPATRGGCSAAFRVRGTRRRPPT